jgi:hypothetical protein
MKITSYNDHLKAPSFPVVFVFKQRILRRSGPSLLSNQSFCGPKLAPGLRELGIRTQRVGEIAPSFRAFGFCEGWDSSLIALHNLQVFKLGPF